MGPFLFWFQDNEPFDEKKLRLLLHQLSPLSQTIKRRKILLYDQKEKFFYTEEVFSFLHNALYPNLWMVV